MTFFYMPLQRSYQKYMVEPVKTKVEPNVTANTLTFLLVLSYKEQTIVILEYLFQME